MSISAFETKTPNAISVEVSGKALSVKLSDGQMLPIPVDRYPRLAYATEQQRANWRILGRGHGIHWEDIDEDISVEGLRSRKGSAESASSLMKWLKANFPPRFCPWRGPDYGKKAKLRLPARLLILGESHYDRDGTLEEGGDTKGVVDDYLKGGQQGRQHEFFTRIIHTVLGPDMSHQRVQFFQSVAFYNYVQCMVGNAPGKRPTKKMWQSAAAPFLATLETLQPTHILACGLDLWDNMPDIDTLRAPDERDKLIRCFGSIDFPTPRSPRSILGRYRHSKGQTVVLAIHHPSRASGAWHPVVKRFLNYRGG